MISLALHFVSDKILIVENNIFIVPILKMLMSW